MDTFRTCARTFKYMVKGWNKTTFGNLKERKKKILGDLAEVHETIVKNQNVYSEIDLEIKLSEELNSILRQEEAMWA